MIVRVTITSALALSIAMAPACITDSIPTDTYSPSADSQAADAAPDARKAQRDAGTGEKRDTGPATEPEADDDADDDVEPEADLDVDDAGMSSPDAEAGADNGPCDLSGHWLITQHLMSQALGVRQSGLQWYYYELEQSGSDLTVKRGLACGGQALPEDLLGATVTYEAAWPGMIAGNSHAGRTAQVTLSGAKCDVSFEPTSTVIGATASYYVDASRPLPSLDEEASGDSPGWEDWDEDGEPGVTLTVSGIASGSRYSSLRIINDWSGSITPGAETFKLTAADPREESAAYGATSELLTMTSVPLDDPSVQYAQFAKLDADQVQGDDSSVCEAIRELAPMLTAEANRTLE